MPQTEPVATLIPVGLGDTVYLQNIALAKREECTVVDYVDPKNPQKGIRIINSNNYPTIITFEKFRENGYVINPAQHRLDMVTA